jgi:hypothetical protein
MSDGALMTLPIFWARNGLTKTQFYYLKRIGRAPQIISVGTKDLIAPEAEAAWRQEMAKNPIKGSLRKLAEKNEAA